MRGLWGWIDATAVALLNMRRPGVPSGPAPEPSADAFLVGYALPFGAKAPVEGAPVEIQLALCAKHVAGFGASGCGKTTFAHRLRDALVAHEINCIDIDYRGDGFDRALRRLVAANVPSDRVTVYDLRMPDRVFPLNFLGYGPGDAQCRAAVVYGALRKQAPSWGVQLGPDLRGTLIALAETRGSLLDVQTVLHPDGVIVREKLMQGVNDAYAKQFLESYSALPADVQRQRASAVCNKLDEYLHHPVLRACLDAPGAPDLARIMDEPGHVTLVALGADRMPQASLIGAMFVSAIARAALTRVDRRSEDRLPCRLIVDEAQNLLSDEAKEILAEGRRFNLGLISFCQFAGQLDAELRESVKVNCATQLYFHTSASEAADLSTEVVCSLPRDEVRRTLISLPVGSAVLVRRGRPAALVKTLDSPDPELEHGRVLAFRDSVAARSSLPTEHRRSGRTPKSKSEVVNDVRKPFRRKS